MDTVVLPDEQVKALARCSSTFSMVMVLDRRVEEQADGTYDLATDDMHGHGIGVAVFANPESAPEREADVEDVLLLAEMALELRGRLLFDGMHQAGEFVDALEGSPRLRGLERGIGIGNYCAEVVVGPV